MNISVKLRPFDSSLVEDTSMYDKLPYKRDPYRCNAEAVSLVSGNILKYYQCRPGNTYELTDMDNLASEKIRDYQKRESQRLEKISEDHIDIISSQQGNDIPEGLSEGEIEELMEDKSLSDSLTDN